VKIHQKIYEEYYGPIPVDETGKTYEIHHIDGNHNNNDPANLVALSIEDHYKVHYSQHDWWSCMLMSKRMGLSAEERRQLGSKNGKLVLEKGTHNFFGGKIQRETNLKRVENGTHHFLDREEAKRRYEKQRQNGRLPSQMTGWKEKKTKDFMKMLEEGTHPSQVERTCPYCGKVGKGGSMLRWHFDNCKENKK
jgi:hypothetical protein